MTAARAERVMAIGTDSNGKCVVIKATRSDSVANIIRARAASSVGSAQITNSTGQAC